MKSCSATCGIEEKRARERRRALEAVAHAYPGNRWGAPRADRERPGLDVEICAAMARQIEEVLPVRVIARRAEPGELGDFLYVLCGVHRPCLFDLREGLCPPSADVPRAEETYVRIALSPLGRFATLQESSFEIEGLGGGQRLVTERPRYGVESPELSLIVRGLMGIVRRNGIALLDFAFLLQRPADGPDEKFGELYGTSPTLWSFLFDPAPPTTTRSIMV